MVEKITYRAIRHFAVYKNGELTLVMEDRPGKLHSTAHPAPSGPPDHPFIEASAVQADYEDEMGTLLRQANDFDHFLELLIQAGYDILSVDEQPLPDIHNGFRIEDAHGLVGVIWNSKGQLAGLTQQPVSGELLFEHATVTVYRQEEFNLFLTLLQSTTEFEELRQMLVERGFQFFPI